ncbi:hypothetical protein [Psychroserpens sp. SPM9]|uniref:hypothetical protein n=1 Tax=Psychroserpens sp. SPM9 TaxID=2975598 RepID=UPI0021A2E236|nr:hypothetical protein [Psychroserpens sp. SPM9]MDG5492552.1 hypothetical protein [Psychroserpens sp. SPM9]
MKYLHTFKRLLSMVGIVVISVFSITTNLSCEDDLCDAIALADLTIPVVADLFDQFGNPIIDQNTGQIIQGLNELYHNRRTGEVFNNQFPPSQGVLVGDVIDMATSIYNVFSATDCELGNTAGPSTTAPKLTIDGPLYSGEQPLEGMFTPQIPANNKVFTATTFQVLTPGFYSVDFNANAPRNVPEHSFDNNFYFGNNGNYSRKSPAFEVRENPNRLSNSQGTFEIKKNLAPKTMEAMKNMEFYKFLTSEQLGAWYQEKLSQKQK